MRYLLFVIILPCVTMATILHVPEEYATIQLGIDASADGDTVLVQPDLYFENLLIDSREIVLASLYIITGDTTFIPETILDGDNQSPVVTIENCLESVRLSGFTVTHGSAVDTGGGIEIHGSHAELDQLVVIDNFAGESCAWDGEGAGGGIAASFSQIQVTHTRLENNSTCGGWGSGGAGGGIALFHSLGELDHMLIANNLSGAGGGIYCYESQLSLVNSTVADNQIHEYNDSLSEGLFAIGSVVEIWNSIFWAECGQDISLFSNDFFPPNSLAISYSDIHSGSSAIHQTPDDFVFWLTGNLDMDPLFMDSVNSLYELHVDSPCIDAGNPDLDGDGNSWEDDPDDQDPDGTRMDMGALYFDQSEEPPVILGISEFNVNFDYVTFYMENTEPVAWIQLNLSGFTIGDIVGQLESSVMSEGMFISGTESFLLITNLGMSTWIDPGSAPLVSFEIESVSDTLACIIEPIAANLYGDPFTVETSPCIPTDLCGEAGDVEPDPNLDVLDIVWVVDCIMNTETQEFCQCGDITLDGELDILDIVLLVSIIL